jgi:GTP-binding protein YchF
MGLKCGLVGLPSCGKTTVFNAITAAGASGFNSFEVNRAVVNIPDRRITRLAEMYHPQKVVPATLEVVDIPGIQRSADGKGSKLLGNIKDVEALLHVVRCFDDPEIPFSGDKIDPQWDVETVDLEMMAADSTTIENKMTRLEKRVRAGDKDAVRETADCKKAYDAIQEGVPARRQGLTEREKASVYECNLLSLKPVLYIANIKSLEDASNEHVAALRKIAGEENTEIVTICGRDEADITEFGQAEQEELLSEMGLQESSIERLLIAAYRMLGLVNFFTVGEDEVRGWTCKKGDRAPVAAGKIHTDMEKGFIRMEVIRYEDLIELGSEAAVAQAGKQRLEGKEYEVQDGDIVSVRFNKK